MEEDKAPFLDTEQHTSGATLGEVTPHIIETIANSLKHLCCTKYETSGYPSLAVAQAVSKLKTLRFCFYERCSLY